MSEIELLERRVAFLEQEVEGEKMVSRHILEQVRRNGDDIAAIRTRLGRIESRLDGSDRRMEGIEARLSAIEGRLDRLESEFHSFKIEFPRQVAAVMREVLAERDARR